MTWSAFTAWFNANRTAIRHGVMVEIKREAVARYLERLRAGYADSPLDFTDLILRGEAALAA